MRVEECEWFCYNYIKNQCILKGVEIRRFWIESEKVCEEEGEREE